MNLEQIRKYEIHEATYKNTTQNEIMVYVIKFSFEFIERNQEINEKQIAFNGTVSMGNFL